jgi:hypothetical protein
MAQPGGLRIFLKRGHNLFRFADRVGQPTIRMPDTIASSLCLEKNSKEPESQKTSERYLSFPAGNNPENNPERLK